MNVFIDSLDCKDGTQNHTWDKWEYSEDGRTGTTICSKCGMSAMHYDLMRGDGEPTVAKKLKFSKPTEAHCGMEFD